MRRPKVRPAASDRVEARHFTLRIMPRNMTNRRGAGDRRDPLLPGPGFAAALGRAGPRAVQIVDHQRMRMLDPMRKQMRVVGRQVRMPMSHDLRIKCRPKAKHRHQTHPTDRRKR